MIERVVFLDRGSLKAKVRKPSCATEYIEHEKTAVSEIVARLAGTAVAITVGFLLRIVAYWRGWRLPTGLDWEPGKIFQRVAKPEATDNSPGI